MPTYPGPIWVMGFDLGGTMERLGARLLVVVGLVAGLLAAVTPTAGASDGYCGLDGTPGLTTYRWKPTVATGTVSEPSNWVGGVAPSTLSQGDGYLCIPAGVVVRVVAGEEVRVQAFDVDGGGRLDIEEGGKLFAYGDPAVLSSVVRTGATITNTNGTLGGPGLITVDGAMAWTQDGDVTGTLVSDPAAVFDPTAGTTSPGRLVVGSGATLTVDKTSADSVRGGVNLEDRYVIEVRGHLVLGGTTYIAADRGTGIEVTPTGVFELAGDGSVLEGRFGNLPPDRIATFVNEGTVHKSGGDGTSALIVAYSGAGALDVDSGELSVSGGAPGTADAAAGTTVATAGQCSDDYTCSVETSPADPQTARVTVPDQAAVHVEEDAAAVSADDLQPPVSVDVAGLQADAVTQIAFDFDQSIPDLPRRADAVIVQHRANAPDVEIPACRVDGGFPAGVAACIARRVARPHGYRLVVRTRDPHGKWALRKDAEPGDPESRVVAPTGGDGAFGNRAGGIAAVTEWAVQGPGCATARAFGRFTVRRDATSEDHALGWVSPAAGSVTNGVRVPVGDLAQLRRFAAHVRTSGGLQGYVSVERVAGGETWVGTAPVTAADTTDADIAGQPGWRNLRGDELSFTWQQGTASFTGTIEQFLDAHPAEKQGPASDHMAVTFGCAGESFQVDDVRVVSDPDDSVWWDLEAPVDFRLPTQPYVGAPSGCMVSYRDGYPHHTTRHLLFNQGGGDWQVWKSDRADGTGHAHRIARGSGEPGDNEVGFPVTTSGWVSVRLAGNPWSSGTYRVVGAPQVDLRKITGKVPFGRKIVVTGKVRPSGRRTFRAYLVGPGDDLVPTTPSVRGTTHRDGTFTVAITPPRVAGRYGVAVDVVHQGGLATTMGRRALWTRVFKPAPAPEPAPQPAPVTPPVEDVGSVSPPSDDPGVPGVIYERGSRCRYLVTDPRAR